MNSQQHTSDRNNTKKTADAVRLTEALQILASMIAQDIIRKNASQSYLTQSRKGSDLSETEKGV